MRIKTSKSTMRLASRSAFTLVELLVAAAMCMLIMAILSTAFSKAIDTFRYMRSVGNLQEQLRVAAITIKRDLCSPHFGGPFSGTPPFNGPYLSNVRQDLLGWTAPNQGYFTLNPGTSTSEGNDGDGLPSYWMGTSPTLPQMAMTVYNMSPASVSTGTIPAGLTPQNQFYTQVSTPVSAPWTTLLNPDYVGPNGNVLASSTAQVIYFLQAPSQNPTTPGGIPLYTLYRQQQILLPGRPNGTVLPTQPPAASYPDISGASLADVRLSSTTNARLTATPFSQAGYVGTDILLTNVLSFEIKAHWWTATGTEGPTTFAAGNQDYPFAELPSAYDSGTQFNNVGIWIDALQIRIRIWDSKAEQARQITILQDM